MKSADTGIQGSKKESSMQMDLLKLSQPPPKTQPLAKPKPTPTPIPNPVAPSQSSIAGTHPQSMPQSSSCTQVVHYFDRNGALRSGRFVQWIEEGEDKGKVLVSDYEGNQIIPDKIRNIE